MRGLWPLLLLLSPALARDPDQSTKQNYRCGIFIPGKKFREPKAKFFVLQTLPAATCAPRGRPDTKSMRKNCGQMGKNWEKSFLQFDKLWKPFLAKVPGNKRPLDVCGVIQAELGIDNIPAENEKKFKDGMELGFYYNYCGGQKWKDTAVRTKSKVCCKEGVSRNCKELLAELQKEKDKAAANATSSTTEVLPSDAVKFPKGVKSGLGSGPTTNKEEVVDPFGQIDNLLAALNKGVLTKDEVAAVKEVLAGLKERAEAIAAKIKQLQEVLGDQGKLDKPDKEAAISIVALADCIKSVTISLS